MTKDYSYKIYIFAKFKIELSPILPTYNEIRLSLFTGAIFVAVSKCPEYHYDQHAYS